MIPWTTREDKILNDFCYLGVEEVQQIIYEVTGKKRSHTAIQTRASRLGLSLCSHEVCPECGRIVKKLKRNRFSDGLCELCYQRQFLTPNQQRSQILSRVSKDETEASDAALEVERERARIRKQVQRDREKKLQTFSQSRRSEH